jgi:hypothetical protein
MFVTTGNNLCQLSCYEFIVNFFQLTKPINTFLAPLIKKRILRTPMRTRSNSFSYALFKAWTVAPSVGLFGKLTTKPTKPSKPTENQRIFDS